MSQTDKIDKLIKNLKTPASGELDQRIAHLIEQSNTLQPRKLNTWSIIMHSKFTKQIAAAIIIIAALLSLTIFNSTVPHAYAIEQTVEAMRGVRNLQMSMNTSKPIELLMLINQQTGIVDCIGSYGTHRVQCRFAPWIF